MINEGVLLLNKTSGGSSHFAVARLRRILQTKKTGQKIGHGGTLDPLADGLLPILIGSATKLSQYILNKDKRYEVLVQLGKTTDTLDITGTVLTECQDISLSSEEIEKSVSELSGEVDLPVPEYSAVKVGGKKLYELARKGKEIEDIPVRKSFFYDVEVLNHSFEEGAQTVRVGLSCSKGSYIRAWSHELGQKLGCGAVVQELRRTDCFPFSLENAISIEDLEKKLDEKVGTEGGVEVNLPSLFPQAFLPMESLLGNWSKVVIGNTDEELLLNGQISRGVMAQVLDDPEARKVLESCVNSEQLETGVKIMSALDGKLLALLEKSAQNGQLSIKRVFPRRNE